MVSNIKKTFIVLSSLAGIFFLLSDDEKKEGLAIIHDAFPHQPIKPQTIGQIELTTIKSVGATPTVTLLDDLSHFDLSQCNGITNILAVLNPAFSVIPVKGTAMSGADDSSVTLASCYAVPSVELLFYRKADGLGAIYDFAVLT